MKNVGHERPLVMIGAGGHARVLHALALAAGFRFLGVCDPVLAARKDSQWQGMPVLGDDDAVAAYTADEIGLVNGIGQLVGSDARRAAFLRFTQLGYHLPPMIHPAAWVADDVVIEEGAQVMAGAIVQPGCRIGANTIVNTRAGVDHDCIVGPHVHIAPGATICGGVSIGERAFIGSGATIIQGLQVGSCTVIAAGAILPRDLPDGGRLMGAAPRFINNQELSR